MNTEEADSLQSGFTGEYYKRTRTLRQGDAHALFDKEPPAEYLTEWQKRLAQPKAQKKVEQSSIVIFRIGAEILGLPTHIFQEVSEKKAVHRLPHHTQGTLLGVANIRGQLLLCFSLHKLLGIDAYTSSSEATSRRRIHQRMLVAVKHGNRFVFPVDEVLEITRYHAKELLELPETVLHSVSTYSQGILRWNKHSVGVLDDNLLTSALNREIE